LEVEGRSDSAAARFELGSSQQVNAVAVDETAGAAESTHE
jgi:hypothetical protein